VRGAHEPAEVVNGEVAAIVIRARELGFSPARVETALDISPRAMAAIESASRTGSADLAHPG